MSKKEEPLVLLGWGKTKLVDVVDWIGTDKQQELLIMPTKSGNISNYRRASICSRKEKMAFIKYASWLRQLMEKGVF